jgi:hypothetical protein
MTVPDKQSAPAFSAFFKRHSMKQTMQETGGIKIAGTSGINYLGWDNTNPVKIVTGFYQRTFCPGFYNGNFTLLLQVQKPLLLGSDP